MKNGKPYGLGIIEFKDGRKYEGYVKDERLNGQGKLTNSDGSVLTGKFVNGVMIGEGVHSYGKSYFKGTFKNSLAHG